MTAASAEARRSTEEQQRLETALTDLFQHRIVFNQTLGLVIESAQPPVPRIRFPMRHELIGSPTHGRLHGGVISATLDAMGGFALMVAIAERYAAEHTAQVLQRFLKMATIDLRIDYLAPGVGRHFVASAEVMRLGARIGRTQMRLVDDAGSLVATGVGSYVIG